MASSKRLGAGFSLVEVLVSIVVLSVGWLGAARMLLASVRSSSEAATFTAAVNLVRELSEKARMNQGIASRHDAANAYLVAHAAASAVADAPGQTCVASGTSCTAAELARWDMREWQRRVAQALPEARFAVCFDEKPWNAAAGEYAWGCSKTGRNMVVKLGWTPHADAKNQQQGPPARDLPPRLVMQLFTGQPDAGREGS